jgi:hypothetical protein
MVRLDFYMVRLDFYMVRLDFYMVRQNFAVMPREVGRQTTLSNFCTTSMLVPSKQGRSWVISGLASG